MFDLKIFRSTLSDYTKALKKLRSEIELTERAIEDVVFAPVSKTEAKAAIRAWLSTQAGDYRKLMAQHLAFAPKDVEAASNPEKLANNLRMGNLLMLGASRTDMIQGRVEAPPVQQAMCGLFEDAIWKAMDSALESLPWEPNGLSAADRESRLANLRLKLSGLNEEEARMVAEAEKLGISVAAVE